MSLSPLNTPTSLHVTSLLKTPSLCTPAGLCQAPAQTTCQRPISHTLLPPPSCDPRPSTLSKQLADGEGRASVCGWPAAPRGRPREWNPCSYGIQPCVCFIGSRGVRPPGPGAVWFHKLRKRSPGTRLPEQCCPGDSRKNRCSALSPNPRTQRAGRTQPARSPQITQAPGG